MAALLLPVMTVLVGSTAVPQASGFVGIPPDVQLVPSGQITVTEPGTVIDAREVHGYILIKADDVTIRRTRVIHDGYHSIRVFPGVSGAVIEDSEVRCGDPIRTNGLVFGNYTARRVEVTNCRNSFMHSESSPAVILDSRADGKPVNVLPGPVSRPGPTTSPDPQPPPAATLTATATLSPSPGPSPTGGAATSRSDPGPTDVATDPPEPEPQDDPAPLRGGTGGFPDETTTGVPEGTQLAKSESVTSSRNGEVIENLEITGTITVEHSDVTIRNVRVHGTGRYGISVPHRLSGQVSGLVIEDSELTGVSGDRSAGIAPYGRWTARRVDISGFVDGVKVGSGQTIEDSWIRDDYHFPSGSHNDGIQSVGGSDVVIRGNRIEGPWQSQTSAIIISSNMGPIERYTIEGNLLSGGGVTFYLTDKGNSHGPPREIVVRDNIWVTDSWNFGPTQMDRGSDWVWEDNRLDDGTPLN